MPSKRFFGAGARWRLLPALIWALTEQAERMPSRGFSALALGGERREARCSAFVAKSATGRESSTLLSQVMVKLLPLPLFLLFLGLILAAFPLRAMDLVVNGEARAVIVLPDNASRVAQYAARELQAHVALATGARLEIVAEAQAEKVEGKALGRIYVGPGVAAGKAGVEVKDLPANAFRSVTTKEAIFLAGNDGPGIPPRDDATSMGSLFAVYDWLEAHVGARWLWPGDSGTVVTYVTDLASGPEGARTVAAPFMHTRLRIGFGFADMNAAVGDRYMEETNVWLRRHRIARGVNFDYPHAYEKYWEKYGKEHPEYFALRPDGMRAPVNDGHLVQMCVSNLDLHRRIIDNWLKDRHNLPPRPSINGCENDKTAADPSCTCPACRAWDVSGNSDSLSNRYARFWLALQAEGRKHDPEATVIGLAYAGYSEPPEGVQLNDHIIVGIVPPYYFPLEEKDRAAFRKLWDGWAKTGARLFLRPNYFLAGYCLPFIFPHEFGEEFQYARTHGMVATDFDSLTGMWGAQSPNLYLLARLQEEPEKNVEAILDEYYSAFGPAAAPVRAYFAHWEKVTRTMDAEFLATHKGGWAAMSRDGDMIFTPDTMAEGRRRLDEAARAAAGSEDAARRVEFLAAWLRHAELCMKTLAAYHALEASPKDAALKAALAEAKQAVDRYRADHAPVFEAANMAVLRRLEMWSGWRKTFEIKEP